MTTKKSEGTRASVLEVAEELFSNEGFDATSLDAIAARPGSREQDSLYNFGSKRGRRGRRHQTERAAQMTSGFEPDRRRVDSSRGCPNLSRRGRSKTPGAPARRARSAPSDATRS